MVVACVADTAEGSKQERWLLEKQLRGSPKKGKDKVYRECVEKLEKLTRSGGHVVAVYDADRAYQVGKLSKGACKRDVVAALRKDCSPQSDLSVILIEQNVESIVAEIRELRPDLVEAQVFDSALRHKGSRAARDQVLGNAALRGNQALREELQRRMPSLRYLVNRLAQLLGHVQDRRRGSTDIEDDDDS